MTKEQEKDLGIKILRGRESAKRAKEAEDSKATEEEKEARKAEHAKIAEEAKKARNELIAGNYRLVVNCVRRYMGKGIPFLDLIQQGNLGLMIAAGKFDYRKGNKFSTYASWWIRQSITKNILDTSRTIRVPLHIHEQRKIYSIAIRKLSSELERKPTTEEMCEYLGWNIDDIQDILQNIKMINQRIVSLDTPIWEEDGEDGQTYESTIIDESATDPCDAVENTVLQEELTKAANTLTTREKMVLRLRFVEELTLEQIGDSTPKENGGTTSKEDGDDVGLSRERIRQIERDALQRMRHQSRVRTLEDWRESR